MNKEAKIINLATTGAGEVSLTALEICQKLEAIYGENLIDLIAQSTYRGEAIVELYTSCDQNLQSVADSFNENV